MFQHQLPDAIVLTQLKLKQLHDSRLYVNKVRSLFSVYRQVFMLTFIFFLSHSYHTRSSSNVSLQHLIYVNVCLP